MKSTNIHYKVHIAKNHLNTNKETEYNLKIEPVTFRE